MSLIFMSPRIGSKRLAAAVIPQGPVINDIILWKYLLLKSFRLHSFKKSSCGNDLSSIVIYFFSSSNEYVKQLLYTTVLGFEENAKRDNSSEGVYKTGKQR